MRRVRARTSLLQLPEDLVKHILLLLAMANDGAKDIARVLLVSKSLKEMCMSEDFLRAMPFGQAELSDSNSFWSSIGLIIKSARAGNREAYEEIMKRIKNRIDYEYEKLEYFMPLLEECKAMVKGRGVYTRSINKRILSVISQVRTPMLYTDLDILRTEDKIRSFGRQNFHESDLILLDRFDSLRPKLRKCGRIFRFLVKSTRGAIGQIPSN